MLVQHLAEYWERSAPDRTAVENDDGTSFTYREFMTLVRERADQLSQLLREHERFAVLSASSAEYLALFFAAAMTRTTIVPLNHRLTPADWQYQLEDSEAAVLFADESHASIVAGKCDLPSVDVLTLNSAETNRSDVQQSAPRNPQEEDVFCLVYTSGTTGNPKGVQLSQKALISNVFQWSTIFGAYQTDCLFVLPMFHVAAISAALVHVHCGNSIKIVNMFDGDAVVKMIEDRQITQISLVPAMLQAMVDSKYAATTTFPHLRYIAYGASPAEPQLIERARELFGCDFIQGYGLTESGGSVAVLGAEDHRRALAGEPHLLNSCGKPLLATDVKIVDDTGTELPPGESGEVLIRGPQLMDGYLSVSGAQPIKDSWLHTGDVGYIDDEGFIYLRDRMKDLIISGGENIYPREIEIALTEHPLILEAAVIGVRDDKWGEAPLAVVALQPGAQDLSADDLIAFLHEKVARYKIPRRIELVSALPRNGTGKILKRNLRITYS